MDMNKPFDVTQAIDEIIESVIPDNSIETVAIKEQLKQLINSLLINQKSKDEPLYNVIVQLIKIYGTQIPIAIEHRKKKSGKTIID
ncbi:MAG: hypothetical protein PHI42_05765 [Paludibacteraceae bacterium]|nr:hypothetical protein [Paludibacteraceae bacterium]